MNAMNFLQAAFAGRRLATLGFLLARHDSCRSNSGTTNSAL